VTRPFPTVLPPPMAGLLVSYLTPLLAPAPVTTRRPHPLPGDDVAYPDGYVRVETAGGTWMARSEIFFDASAIIHSYVDYGHEPQGEDLCNRALAWGGNSQGLTLPLTDTFDGITYDWYVTYSRITALCTEHSDPLVRLTRYRGMVTWRCAAIGLPEPTPVTAVHVHEKTDQPARRVRRGVKVKVERG
jgi:hypothetical protein